MTKIAFLNAATAVVALAFTMSPSVAEAQSGVQYGRVTSAVAVTTNSSRSQNTGAVVGGVVGMASGSGQSSSNRALRTVGGAAAGRGVGTLAGRSQSIEYTVLVGGKTTIRIVSDQVGKRVGDCVAVERGQFNNIRLVSDDRCATPASGSTNAAANRNEAEAASACNQAKSLVLAAETDAAFASAERRMRLVCGE
jgi:outer membrane lipoprotein SlyB